MHIRLKQSNKRLKWTSSNIDWSPQSLNLYCNEKKTKKKRKLKLNNTK